VDPDRQLEHVLRASAPAVLAAVTRRYGHFDAAEDAVQEALVAAATQWPRDGVPDNPRAWLIRVSSRRLTDALRSEGARRRREEVVAEQLPTSMTADDAPLEHDDTLALLFLCCHPDLSPPSQIALTLRAVGGLTTGEIAHAFLVPEATMGQRISRAKATIKKTGAQFAMPPADERAARTRAVLHVLYLVFNEGYATTSGASLQRLDLTREAIRLTRMLHELLPADGEVRGLLALMLLTEARSAARTDANGDLVPLTEQDRSLWDRTLIDEGIALVTEAMRGSELGPYQLQAAIAALHDEAPTAADTDWPQILALYDILERASDNPMVTLNHAVATAMVHGPHAGLAMLDALESDPRVSGHHRIVSVRAHLLELAGDLDAAARHFRDAAQRTTSAPERRFLLAKAAACRLL
jgi:RNA polymerase sigma factor (sigma-70 family)